MWGDKFTGNPAIFDISVEVLFCPPDKTCTTDSSLNHPEW